MRTKVKRSNMGPSLKKSARRNLIRGPKSPWIFFIKEKHKELKLAEDPTQGKRNPSFSELCHTWSPVWKGLNDQDKRKFHQLHCLDKERYSRELADLDPSEREKVERSASRRKVRDTDLPKPVRSGYIWFVQTERAKVIVENPQMSFSEIGKELGRRWNALSSEDKAPFRSMNASDKTRYSTELAEYKKKKMEGVGQVSETGVNQATTG